MTDDEMQGGNFCQSLADVSVRTRASDGGLYFLKSHQSSRVNALTKEKTGSKKAPKRLRSKGCVHAQTGLNVRFKPRALGGVLPVCC